MKTTNSSYPEIPLNAGQVTGWKEISIKNEDHSDPLVPLGPLSQEAAGIATSSIYFGEHSNSPYAKTANKLKGSLLTLFARQSVARRLLTAEQFLPSGYHLLVFDTYRPYQVQKSLYDFYRQKLKENQPLLKNEVLDSETQKYVSLPSVDPTRPSPHNTGGAVDAAIIKLTPEKEKELVEYRSRLADSTLDLPERVGIEMRLSALIRQHGTMLEFGTAFDHGGEKAALAYYEFKRAKGEKLTATDEEARLNRRLLYDVMTKAGFMPYFAEWWHFNAPESQMGAAAAGRTVATMGAAQLDKNNEAHEHMRLKLRQDAVTLLAEESGTSPQTDIQAAILAVLHETGDPCITNDWPTEIIAPPK